MSPERSVTYVSGRTLNQQLLSKPGNFFGGNDPMPVTREQFQRFVQERKYLQNVSPNTILIYEAAWRKWERFGPDSVSFVAGMRNSGATAIGCNIYIRALNACFHWAGEKPIPKLKAEDKIPPTFSIPDVQKLLKFRPSKRQTRTHLLALLLLDTGLRISEALSLKISDIDWDNMLFSVRGKGGKNRLVPFSLELRRRIWKSSSRQGHELLFSRRKPTHLSQRHAFREESVC